MNITPGQYAALSAAFGTTQANALIDFLNPQFQDAASQATQQIAQAIAALPVPQWVPAARVKDVPFATHALRPTLGIYMVRLYVPLTILVTSGSAEVRLIVNGNQQGVPLHAPSGALGLSQAIQMPLIGMFPSGATAEVQTTVTGNGEADLLSSHEFLF